MCNLNIPPLGYTDCRNSIPIHELQEITNQPNRITGPNKIKEHMQMKKYLFTISYEEKVNNMTQTKFGTLSLWANDLIRANDLFKRLYCDNCEERSQLNVTCVSELPNLNDIG